MNHADPLKFFFSSRILLHFPAAVHVSQVFTVLVLANPLSCYIPSTPSASFRELLAMHRLLIALTLAATLHGATVAQEKSVSPEKTAAMAPVHQFVDGFNKGDTKTALAACADQTSIIDEFPPHEWHGSGACAQWASDFAADAKKNGITDGRVTLGALRHIDITGDRAYVVVPSSYSYKQNGKPMKETGSIFTFVLQKSAAGWRIVAWTWSKN
jgi:ketosteroid isomerase-like protein